MDIKADEDEATEDSAATRAPPILSNEILPEKARKAAAGAGAGLARCEDRFKNCAVVVQSRLCRYAFYTANCCSSCRHIQHQHHRWLQL